MVVYDVKVADCAPKAVETAQNDVGLATLVLTQMAKDIGDGAAVGYVNPMVIAPLERRDVVWKQFVADHKWSQKFSVGKFSHEVAKDNARLASAALKKHPMLNTWVDDVNNEMIHKSTFDIGIATATDAGLIVPVVRNADRLSIIEIAREIARLAADARVGKVNPADVGGSTFTVTSLGKLGGLFSTPVVNYPEVAILGIHKIQRTPRVVDDRIVARDVMYLSVSIDHRINDGATGARWMNVIKEMLEDPKRILVGEI